MPAVRENKNCSLHMQISLMQSIDAFSYNIFPPFVLYYDILEWTFKINLQKLET